MFLFLLFLCLVCAIVLLCIPMSQLQADSSSPLNFALYQQPKTTYPEYLVNEWVEKPWMSSSTSRIPCILHTFNDSQKLIIYSHANAENILTCSKTLQELSILLKINIVAYDYSGYGLNEFSAFERSADGINSTLQAVYNHFTNEDRFKNENVYLMGYSLGTGPTISVATNLKHLGGVILIAPYSSILEVVKDVSSEWLGNNAASSFVSIFKERWNNVRNIAQIKSPILLLHGTYDRIIPLKHAHKLKQANPSIKLQEMECGHDRFKWELVANFITEWMQ